MEPRQHEVVSNVEQAPVQPGVGEQMAQGYERNVESGAEKVPEVGQVQAEISQLAMPSLPVPVLAAPTIAAQDQANSATPLAASDDDLIEKEWVDKAKSIIATTKDDPYRREREINKLQIEYIRKRYGRTIGDAGD
ncbi:MAG: hypothetical protein WBO49_04490 [Candidatus Saccharimonas sp.]